MDIVGGSCVTRWVNVVLLLCVQQLCKCSRVLGYALMLLEEVNGGLSSERGGDNVREGPEALLLLELSFVTAGGTAWSRPTVIGDKCCIC